MLRSKFLSVHPQSTPISVLEVANHVQNSLDKDEALLRWGIVDNHDASLVCEVGTITSASGFLGGILPIRPRSFEGLERTRSTVALVVPTGVGASIGGFIGDAGCVARAFRATGARILTHPNVVNGAALAAVDGLAYADGLSLDRFFSGQVRLGGPVKGPLGVILEVCDEREYALSMNAVSAASRVWGVDIVDVVVTTERIAACIEHTEHGHFSGVVHNPIPLLEAAETLVRKGARALAATSSIDGVSATLMANHYRGDDVNPVGAVEALISRYLTAATGLPCAHAPMYGALIGRATGRIVDPRAAAETISRSGLPSVLQGLPMAPVPVESGGIDLTDLGAIVVPHSCAGGVPAIAAEAAGIPLVAVRSNQTRVGYPAHMLAGVRVIEVNNYAEAIGVTVALLNGGSVGALLSADGRY